MNNLSDGLTVGGLLTAAAGIVTLLWKRSGDKTEGAKKVAQWASAIARLQIAEGELDYLKDALKYCREENNFIQLDSQATELENQRLRVQVKKLTHSRSVLGGEPSSDGSTEKDGEKSPGKRPS